MWSAVVPCDVDCPAPSARSKHSATLIGGQVYLLGGRNGNLPLKDFWKYNLANGKWTQLKPNGTKLPSLQEHSAVAYKENIYIFGGEVGFSAATETPLWVYEIKSNTWRKVKSKQGVARPKGRRGHTALVQKGTMLIYGGYQDLRGSCSELWAYHFETESWHLLSSPPAKGGNVDTCPPARHKHSAILHDDSMWIYGGMTDLQERSDLWKWDTVASTWTNVKTKLNPGPLHSHAICRLPSSMIIFGGERDGHPTNDLWRFSFTTELWEKVTIVGQKPQPRAESIALAVSELVLNDTSANSLENKTNRTRARTCNSADRGGRHPSCLPNNRVSPYEQTFVFKPSQSNYTDGSDLAQQYSENVSSQNNRNSFLQEITKLSHLNIARLNNKCTYTVLTGCNTDSTESLLRQHASPTSFEHEDDLEISTPSRGTMVKSKSAFVIKKRFDTSPTCPDNVQKSRKRVEFDPSVKLPREPISVPNFSILTLPTPALTPVEAARLVFLDTDEENDDDNGVFIPPILNNVTNVKPTQECNLYENFKPMQRGESYSSHLGYADNPLYQHIVNSNYININYADVPETSDENVSSTSDYASIETVNRLSSSSNCSDKFTPQEDCKVKLKVRSEGPFGFCNPNYLGPDINAILTDDGAAKKQFAKVINTPDSVLEDFKNLKKDIEEDILELQNYNGVINKNTAVVYHNCKRNVPPKCLELENGSRSKEIKTRASSASRVEKKLNRDKLDFEMTSPLDPYVPMYVFVIGGKEQGQVTVFKRPLSIWKLKLF